MSLGSRIGVIGAAATAAGGVGSQAPNTVTGLKAWYQFGALALADGATLTPVSDSAGVQPNTQQFSTAAIYKTAQKNGLGCIRQPAGGTVFVTMAATYTQALTVYIVMRSNGTLSGATVWKIGANFSGWCNTGNFDCFAGTDLTGGVRDNNFHLITYVFNGASSKLRVDGVQVASGNAGTNGTGTELDLTGGGASTSNDFGEFCLFTGDVSASGVETYLKNKWGF